MLLCLLLRLSLHKPKWGTFSHYGSLYPPRPAYEKLADNLVDGIGGNRKAEFLTLDELDMCTGKAGVVILDNNPPRLSNIRQASLELRFHQLWAVLFQPTPRTCELFQSESSENLPHHILGALVLSIPQSFFSSHFNPVSKDTRIALEISNQDYRTSSDLSMTCLVRTLAQSPNPMRSFSPKTKYVPLRP